MQPFERRAKTVSQAFIRTALYQRYDGPSTGFSAPPGMTVAPSNVMETNHSVSIVLVHGGFVDASGWAAVYRILKRDGYHVSVVQNPTESLSDDVAATELVVSAQDRPVILVGHSYGG